ncbi:MAG: MBL fold metallo-hydrolase [Bacteroidales bacterium]|jgi:glyoxylase-like metal-dependent hydrolase (beta-lactamase superfamily II)
MECKTFYFNALRTCCYVAYDATGCCIIIDPGCFGENEEQRLVHYLRDHQLTPRFIVNTHAHFDHLMGLRFLLGQYDIPFRLHSLEEHNLKRASDIARLFGFQMIQPECDYIPLEDGETLTFGTSALKVIHTPGHSPGSVCLYDTNGNRLFSGDLLFAGSVGRTDLPGGDYNLLAKSLSEKISPLPAQTVVLPGHGPATTLAEETAHNPYLQDLS